MRIYLDSCVYQNFKRNPADPLFNLISRDSKSNVYCFSEAHVYDLVRDLTEEKFSDMALIEQIAFNNCFFYDKKIQFEHFTPLQYFHRYDWTPTVKAFARGESNPLSLLLRLVPLDFKQFINFDQIPPDCPQSFIELLSMPTNMYEFFNVFLDLTEELTDDRKKFKEFIKYLHANALVANIYDSLGLKGFDGTVVTDKEAFKQSYMEYHYERSVDKHMNWLFANMYNGLELFGIVKGKPRKQQMMNMINDGKHAYFGTFCDVVVSEDEDFIKKTKFLYDLFDIKTEVITSAEFHIFLTTLKPMSTLSDCLDLINSIDMNHATMETNDEGDHYVTKLPVRCYRFFNRLAFAPRERLDNFYFLRQSENWSSGTLAKEIENVTNALSSELGADVNNRSIFSDDEFRGEDWEGRTWLMPNSFIELKFGKGLYLRIGFLNNSPPGDDSFEEGK